MLAQSPDRDPRFQRLLQRSIRAYCRNPRYVSGLLNRLERLGTQTFAPGILQVVVSLRRELLREYSRGLATGSGEGAIRKQTFLSDRQPA